MMEAVGSGLEENAAPSCQKRRDLRATLDRILAAAETEFANLGFEGVRMQDVARRARVSRQTLYTYFPDRLSLFQELYRRIMRRNGEMLFRVEYGTMEPILALTTFVENLFSHYSDHNGRLAVEFWNCDEAVKIERLTPEITWHGVEVLDEILERGQSVGVFRLDIDGETVLRRSIAVCIGLISSAGLMSRIFMHDHHSNAAMKDCSDFCVQSILNLARQSA